MWHAHWVPLWFSRLLSDSRITGWRRLIGSPKLQIIFHKRATKYRLFLRKMTYKDKGSYESSPSCTSSHSLILLDMSYSCHTHEWVMSHTLMSHVTHVKESCHTHKWVMSHTWISHVKHIDESWHTYAWVKLHIWMSPVTYRHELSCRMCTRMLHTWIDHLIHMNTSCHAYG